MLIPFGVFSAGAGNGAAAGSYELISTTYGTGSSNTITLSSIPQTYKHLQLRIVSNSGDTNTYIRFNGVSSGSYAWHRLYGNGSSVYSDNSTGTTEMIGSNLSSNQTDIYGVGIIDILDYASTTKNKTMRIFSGQRTTNPAVSLISGLFLNTAAISSFTIFNFSGGFTTASRISLYGIKG